VKKQALVGAVAELDHRRHLAPRGERDPRKLRSMTALGIVALGAASIAAPLSACATSDDSGPSNAPEENRALAPDAAADAPSDAQAESGDGGACTDCEYFPESCSDDVLCHNGPFGPGGFDPLTQINLIGGRAPNDVWIAGALGAVAHFDGTSWLRQDLAGGTSVHALWLRDSMEISFLALDQIFGRGIDVPDAGPASPNGWVPAPTSATPADYRGGWLRALVAGFAAPGATWFWGATQNVCDGSFSCRTSRTSGLWRVRFEPPSTFTISSVIPPALCQQIQCGDMRAIHGSSADDLWAVGDRGAILRIGDADSDTPQLRAFNSQTWNALYGVWAASSSDAWAVGKDGVVRHYAGAAAALWDVVSDVPTTNDLFAVSGTSSSDVWVVGDAATVLHYDGKAWSRIKIAGLGARRPKLTAVWTTSPGHVWIGGQGVLLSLGGKP